MYCERCGAKGLSGRMYCAACGNRINDLAEGENIACKEEKLQFCKSCGTPAEANYCTACGKTVIERSNWSIGGRGFSIGDFKGAPGVNEAKKAASQIGETFKSAAEKVKAPESFSSAKMGLGSIPSLIAKEISRGLKAGSSIFKGIISFCVGMGIMALAYTVLRFAVVFVSSGRSLSSNFSTADFRFDLSMASLIHMKWAAEDTAVQGAHVIGFVLALWGIAIGNQSLNKSKESTAYHLASYVINAVVLVGLFWGVSSFYHGSIQEDNLTNIGVFASIGYLISMQVMFSVIYKGEDRYFAGMTFDNHVMDSALRFLKSYGIYATIVAVGSYGLYIIQNLRNLRNVYFLPDMVFALPNRVVWLGIFGFGVPVQTGNLEKIDFTGMMKEDLILGLLLVTVFLFVVLMNLLIAVEGLRNKKFFSRWTGFSVIVALLSSWIFYFSNPRTTETTWNSWQPLTGGTFWISFGIIFAVALVAGVLLYSLRSSEVYHLLLSMWVSYEFLMKSACVLLTLFLMWKLGVDWYLSPTTINYY